MEIREGSFQSVQTESLIALIQRECGAGAPHLTVDQGAESSWNLGPDWNLQRPALSTLLRPAVLGLLKIPQSPKIATN